MSREATVVTLGARLPLALPEEPKRESRWEQRSEVAKTARGMFRADASEGERITDFDVGAEVQSDCGCVAGSFDNLVKGQDWHLLLKTTPDRDTARNMRKRVCELSFMQ